MAWPVWAIMAAAGAAKGAIDANQNKQRQKGLDAFRKEAIRMSPWTNIGDPGPQNAGQQSFMGGALGGGMKGAMVGAMGQSAGLWGGAAAPTAAAGAGAGAAGAAGAGSAGALAPQASNAALASQASGYNAASGVPLSPGVANAAMAPKGPGPWADLGGAGTSQKMAGGFDVMKGTGLEPMNVGGGPAQTYVADAPIPQAPMPTPIQATPQMTAGVQAPQGLGAQTKSMFGGTDDQLRKMMGIYSMNSMMNPQRQGVWGGM